PDGERLAEAEHELAAERDEFGTRWGEGVGGGAAAEVRGELAALSSGVERGESEAQRLQQRFQGLTEKVERLAAEAQRLREDIAGAESSLPQQRDAVIAAEGARANAESRLADAEAALRAADAERHAWSARADALALALDDARARAGVERLVGVDG